MAIVGYCRVSTDKQDNSLEAQERAIEGYCQMKGAEASIMYVDRDAYSGNLERPQLQQLLGQMEVRAFDAVVVTKLDRLTRSTRDAIFLMERFHKAGVALVSLNEGLDTESAFGRAMVKIIATFSELERELIGERTKAGMANLKRNRMPVGPPPYGWSSQGKKKPLIENEYEQKVVHHAQSMLDAECTFDEISGSLNDRGFRTRNGTPWSRRAVEKLAERIGRTA